MICGLAAAAALAMPQTGLGATNGFVVPTFRGSANAEFGYWEVFSMPVGAPGNLPDQSGATTGAVLTQTNAYAFLTGSGNIYNPSGISSFRLTDETPFALGTVVLQTRTIGSELNHSSVSLIYTNDSGAQALAPLFRFELSRIVIPGQGGGVSSLWQWDLTGLGVSNYTIAFNAAGPHLSFDSMTLDAAAQFAKAFPEQPFTLQSTPANLARWMYPFNANPASRPTASVFGALGSTPHSDSRNAQYLLGWTTTNRIPAGLGATNYLIRRARLTLTLASGNQYTYTGGLRDYRTHFPTNDVRYIAPATSASPVELFGAGFRGGYAAATYPQDGPWGVVPGVYYTNRTAYAAGFDTNGVLVDVSNNVGDDGTNEIAAPFEIAPFAVGQTTNVADGELMPVGSQLTFDLNLADPLIHGYVQQGLNDGNVSFMVASLVRASRDGPPTFPNFYTIFSPIASSHQFPLLDLDGAVVRPNHDSDGDGLPDDWENFHFASLIHSATNDGDGDGLNNLAEYRAGTSPASSSDALRLHSIAQTGHLAELHFAHAPGRQYSVRWSDDLLNWQTVTNPAFFYSSAWLAKTGTNLVYPSPAYAGWRDTNAPGQQRFYRVELR